MLDKQAIESLVKQDRRDRGEVESDNEAEESDASEDSVDNDYNAEQYFSGGEDEGPSGDGPSLRCPMSLTVLRGRRGQLSTRRLASTAAMYSRPLSTRPARLRLFTDRSASQSDLSIDNACRRLPLRVSLMTSAQYALYVQRRRRAIL